MRKVKSSRNRLYLFFHPICILAFALLFFFFVFLIPHFSSSSSPTLSLSVAFSRFRSFLLIDSGRFFTVGSDCFLFVCLLICLLHTIVSLWDYMPCILNRIASVCACMWVCVCVCSSKKARKEKNIYSKKNRSYQKKITLTFFLCSCYCWKKLTKTTTTTTTKANKKVFK